MIFRTTKVVKDVLDMYLVARSLIQESSDRAHKKAADLRLQRPSCAVLILGHGEQVFDTTKNIS
jgi:hypothetical protein